MSQPPCSPQCNHVYQSDVAWSKLNMLPGQGSGLIRSCDLDVTVFCNVCGLPIFLVEQKVAGVIGPERYWANSRYARTMAEKLGVPAYFVETHVRLNKKEQGPKIIKVMVQLLDVEDQRSWADPLWFTQPEYVEWSEAQARNHRIKEHGEPS